MRKVFWEDPYQSSLTTKVAALEGDRILLEETIAFSFSGGQESDQAWINDLSVIDSTLEGDLIWYTLAEGHKLSIGQPVLMKIDWPRRYQLMRLHFAAELILELVTRHLKLEKIGAHIAQDKARIDFIFDQNIALYLDEILKEYNQIIKADLPIKKDFSNNQTHQRYWQIEGFAQVPCGGTHVKATGEVGGVTLKRKNIGRSKERIEIRLEEEVS